MQSRNPVFNRSSALGRGGYATFDAVGAQQLEEMYSRPSATTVETGRMSMDDVVVKTGILLAILVAVGAVSWALASPLLTLGGLVVGLVLGLVIAFRGSTNAALISTYAAAEGAFLGGISQSFETQWNGIVAQAVLATLGVFAVALFAYRSGRIRVTPKFQRGMLIAIGGYAVFCLVNLVVSLFGVGDGWGLRQGPLGFAIGLFAVGLAALSLILDFDFAEQGIRNGLPQRYSWFVAFGLVVTLVWLYIELLRLIAILRGDD